MKNTGGNVGKPKRLAHKPKRSKQGVPLYPQPWTVKRKGQKKTVQDQYARKELD